MVGSFCGGQTQAVEDLLRHLNRTVGLNRRAERARGKVHEEEKDNAVRQRGAVGSQLLRVVVASASGHGEP